MHFKKMKINLEFTFDKHFPRQFSGHKLLSKPTQFTNNQKPYKIMTSIKNLPFCGQKWRFKMSKGFLSLFLMHFILCYSSVRKFVTLHLARTYRSTLLRFDRSVEHHFARETSTTWDSTVKAYYSCWSLSLQMWAWVQLLCSRAHKHGGLIQLQKRFLESRNHSSYVELFIAREIM